MGTTSSKVEAPPAVGRGSTPTRSATALPPKPTVPMMAPVSMASLGRSPPLILDRHNSPLRPSQHHPTDVFRNWTRKPNLKTRIKKLFSPTRMRAGPADNSWMEIISIPPTLPVEPPSEQHYGTVPKPPALTGNPGVRQRPDSPASRGGLRTRLSNHSSMDMISILPPSPAESTDGGGHLSDAAPMNPTISSKKSSISRLLRGLRTGKDSGYASTGSGISPNMKNLNIRPPFPVQAKNQASQAGKLFVSIDFGATYSGISYATSGSGKVNPIISWPGSSDTFHKIPTCLVYDSLDDVRAWGIEAKDIGLRKGWVRCEWFKLLLDPASAPNGIPASLPPGKKASDLVVDFLSSLWTYAKGQILQKNDLRTLNYAEVYLTVPSSWGVRMALLLRESAVKAGLVVQVSPEDTYWQERLHIIPETEASVLQWALSQESELQPDQNIMICNAGGGAVDFATYRISSALETPEFVEAGLRSGSYCGSLFLDLRFRELIRARLAGHPMHLDEASLANFVLQFSGSEKLGFTGPDDDEKMFHFRCLRLDDSYDLAVGLENGELIIPGYVLRQQVFDPVIDKVLDSITRYIQASRLDIHVLLLVGGFSANEYLFRRISAQFSPQIDCIVRPPDGDTASCFGGAAYGLRPLVSSVIPSQSVVRRVDLPAEPIDRLMRSVYITRIGGEIICRNRLAYIIEKGTSLPKSSRVEVQMRKYCSASYDTIFEVDLYTSNADRIMRYDDEGDRDELCRCVVDLEALPSFRNKLNASPLGQFPIDFVLGFEMDSAEIRCVLLYRGEKCGTVTCDTRS